MSAEALGMIEARGTVGSIEAADAMLQAANEGMVGYVKSGAGLIAAKDLGITLLGSLGPTPASVTRPYI